MNQQKEGKEKINCCDNKLGVKIDHNYKLGEGGYAKVYKGFLYQQNNEDEIVIPIAVKRTTIKKNLLPYQKKTLIDLTNQEIQILKQAIHPNIVKFYGSCHHKHLNEEYIDIYLELCECNLKEYITSMNYKNENVLLDIFSKIIEVTQFLCSLRIMSQNQERFVGIYHRDLNMRNILVKGHVLKLTDFGLAKPKPQDNIFKLSTRRGTPIYMSPENFNKQQYDLEKNDVWSMGVLLYQLFYGYTEFKPQDAHENKLKFPNLDYPQLQELLQNHMLCGESTRYNFSELSEHFIQLRYQTIMNNQNTLENNFLIRVNILYDLYSIRFNEYKELYQLIKKEIEKYKQKSQYRDYINILQIMLKILFEAFYGFYQAKQSQYLNRYITVNKEEEDQLMNILIMEIKKTVDQHIIEYSESYQQFTNNEIESLEYLYQLNQLFKYISKLKLQFNQFQENSDIPKYFKKFMEWKKRKFMYKEEIINNIKKQYREIEKKHQFFNENSLLILRKRNSNAISMNLFKYGIIPQY